MSRKGVALRRPFVALALGAALAFGTANATGETAAGPLAADAADAPPFKLTFGSYRLSGGGSGTDVNLRHGSELGNIWIGYFESGRLETRQWRTGWDRSFGDGLRVTPSIQVASHDFVGGSVQFETGAAWFAGVGFGRTNLKPYWNLNFDPNDSFTLSAGHRTDDGRSLLVQYVRDNRQNPDQRHLHFVWRQPVADRQRLTLDLLHKQGLVDDQLIRRWGASLTYDWPRFFLRLAHDPKANFGSDDLWRLSIGTRF